MALEPVGPLRAGNHSVSLASFGSSAERNIDGERKFENARETHYSLLVAQKAENGKKKNQRLFVVRFRIHKRTRCVKKRVFLCA